jgi:hypothetical protein
MKIFEVASKASRYVSIARERLSKLGLLNKLDVGLLPKSDRDVEITVLEVKTGNQFGKGAGTQAISLLTGLADELGIRLSLLPRSSYDHDDDPRFATAPDQDSLEKWYGKYGFKFLPNPDPDDMLEFTEEMFREPK